MSKSARKLTWVGVDLGQKEFVAAIAPQEETAPTIHLPHRAFANTPEGRHDFLRWLRTQGLKATQVSVCMEATGMLAVQWARPMRRKLGAVAIVNPARPAAYGKSLGIFDKTDRVDAVVLAWFGRKNQPKPRKLPSLRDTRVKSLVRLRRRVEQVLQGWKQHLQVIGLGKRRGAPTAFLRAHEALIEWIDEQIDELLFADPQRRVDFERLQTIPGVGAKTARLVLAELGDLRQYSRSEIISFTGLFPRLHQSGTSVEKRPRLVKGGGAHLRAGIYFPAITAKRYCPTLNQSAQNMLSRGMAPKAVVGAIMRKLLLLMRALLVSNTDYNPNHPLQNQGQPLTI